MNSEINNSNNIHSFEFQSPTQYENINSIVISLYMLDSFLYYLVDYNLRIIFFGIIICLSSFSFFVLSRDNPLFSLYNLSKSKILKISILCLFFSFFITFANNSLNPVILYSFFCPILSYFVFTSRFNTKIIIVYIYLIFLFISMYYLKYKSFEDFFPEMSRNYISVVLIMNVSILQIIQWKQKEKVDIKIPIIALFISLLAMGRSGIICSAILVFNAMFLNWKYLEFSRKFFYFIIIIILLAYFLVARFSYILLFFENWELLNKFTTKGLESHARDQLIQEYINHINFKTFLLGYDYHNNFLFIQYKQNPHNSFIRLHHFLGLFSIPVFIFIIRSIIKFIVKRNFFLLSTLLAVILRSWTDTYLFLSFYDFILILLIFIAYDKKNEYSRNDIINSF